MYSNYNDFADIYDRYWAATYADRAMETLELLLLRKLGKKREIMDLCCGSGRISANLTAHGYRVTGLDSSRRLIEKARQNSPDSRFIVADAREFELEHPVDAVICLNDSLNHMLTKRDLAKAIQNVSRSLLSGGYFLFDVNMQHKYSSSWDGSFSIVEDDTVCAVVTSTDAGQQLAFFDATVFAREDGAWIRMDVRLTQTWYDVDTFMTLLADAGFSELSVSDQSGKKIHEENTDRAFFLCKKT